ncbi:hypothetical protein C5167_047161 [Papaver somniferum]|uniref:Uncharacterized protein n=1 Tax=Papaver somniferum TaxID=3469 RepID=A0A4Y7LGL7_PAPSO|nr:hypothetical protein C5167_047161 [Papaver somniferum]
MARRWLDLTLTFSIRCSNKGLAETIGSARSFFKPLARGKSNPEMDSSGQRPSSLDEKYSSPSES